jgi:hypothetical protein
MKRLLILIFFLVFFPGHAVPANSPVIGGQKFLLFYSNDINGETEPCG